MRRVFWLALGATVGVLVVRRLTRTAQAYTPEGLARSVAGLGDAIREFGERVVMGMHEREIELRDALGVDAGPDIGGPHVGGPHAVGTHRRDVH